MTQQQNNSRNERISFSRWITAKNKNGNKPVLMVLVAVFIWMLFAGYQQSRLQVQRMEIKIRKHTSGLAKLASLSRSIGYNSDNNKIAYADISADNKFPEDESPAIEIEFVSDIYPEACKAETTAVSKPDPVTKKKETDSTDSAENKTPNTTATANRKPVKPAPRSKQKSGAQQHFGVGLKLSI